MINYKLIIATLDTNETYAIRILTHTRATTGDYITAILPEPPTKASIHAWQNLALIAQRLGIEPLEPTTLPTHDAIDALAKAVNILTTNADKTRTNHIIIEATDGPKAISTTLLLATLILTPKLRIEYYIQDTHPDNTPIKIDQKLIQTINLKQTKERLEIIKTIIQNPGITTHQLAQKLNKNKKTTQNLVSQLKKQGLITQKGRKGGLYPTKLASIIKILTETEQ